MITSEQLRDWARRINLGGMDDVLDLADELRTAADKLDAVKDRLKGVPEIAPQALTYRNAPRFVSAGRAGPVGYSSRWLLLAPAATILDAETVDVHRLDGTTVTVAPLDVVGWRKVRRKGGAQLFVLMTFERFVDEIDDGVDDKDITPEWTQR